MSRRCVSAAVAAVAISGACLWIASEFRRAREACNDANCNDQLMQIGLALSNYHDEYNCLPPAYTLNHDGSRMHSWRTMAFSSAWKERDMQDLYDFSSAWNEGVNSNLINYDTHGFFYWCPSGDGRKTKMTDYVAVVGPHTAWPGDRPFSQIHIGEGPSNTILVVEVADSRISWMEPRDYSVRDLLSNFRRVRHKDHFNALFADGRVRRISRDISADALRSLVYGRWRRIDGGLEQG